ncbi:MAG: glucose-1-phosphate adenylyltransferase [Eubacteriales bacterium]|nr:glucose-1-phosphate adenylyltransferase [Eubacteriales bacterium]MDD4583219.1 glucose-1-phosphate adenylyltransferase [Eubacteriales bacterium]
MTYHQKKEVIAMLLAGGQGSRLGVLTDHVAKPAIPFGGKYRIIDFPLSNCVNSGIDTIGVLTQYQPLELNTYIGSGQPWDLDRLYGGSFILPPYVKGKAGEWYKGTANAIYQNIKFIDLYDPDYVLILSGDHIYKMNYNLMLKYHKEKKADCTIAVIQVPWEEAGRFGVMNADADLRIREFEEKPKEPKSNLASMGVYIFSWQKLKEYLLKDKEDKDSQSDFGKNIIPTMLNQGEKLYAYEFKGYWKDVGTIESLWEANMDTLNQDVPLELDDPPWRIYSRSSNLPPQFIGEHAQLINSSIADGCFINGTVENSILFPGVQIEKGAVISNSILMPGVVVDENAVVEYAIIANKGKVGQGVHIGYWKLPEIGGKHRNITVIGQEVLVAAGAVVPAGAIVGENVIEEV